jgi:cell wall assembly regulator SMI1
VLSELDRWRSAVADMEKLIARLDRWLKEHRPAYYAELQPGLSGPRLREFQREVGFRMPNAFKELYAWRNGQDPRCSTALQHNRMFMSIEDVLDTHRLLNELLEGGEFDGELWWCPRWVPFLDNGSGDHQCIDMGGAFAGVEGQVINFWHDWESRNIEYSSLEKWLETFVASLEAGLWREVGGDLHPIDEDRWDAFLGEMNPGYPIKANAR